MKQFFGVAALLALVGCAGDKPAPRLFCPNVAVLEQAAVLPEFADGQSDDVANEVTSAQITGVAGACTLVPKKHVLRVKFQAGFAATNGPANQGAALSLPYFVSISQGDTIISKTPYTIGLSFDGNVSSSSAVSKPVTVELPNVPESGGIDILVGFQLTDAQLAYLAAHPVVP